MSPKKWILSLTIRIVAVDLLVILAALGWIWYSGNASPVELSNIFFIGGAILIIAGAIAPSGSLANRSNWKNMLAESASVASLDERNGRMMNDIQQTYSFMIITILAGVICIGIAVLFGQI